ncbi:MAG: aspartyl protease family protein [Alphaproteobacteria bacterium]|nr:aspartyl protease family protein [Alphaproteobacteria bacterium]
MRTSPTCLAVLTGLSCLIGLLLPLSAGADDRVRGPRHDTIPLYKAWPGGDKLYVEVDLGDGQPRLMLLDSGAGVTLVSPEVADALGLQRSVDTETFLQVSGTLEARKAVVPEVRVGGFRVPNVVVAVPEQPVHDTAGLVPTAGLLGNNVLSGFHVVVDYPANRLELHRKGTRSPPEGAAPLYFDGQHAMTGAILHADGPDGPVAEQVLVDVDTGARDVWLFGEVGGELAALATEGLAPVVGVSSSEGMPLHTLLRTTRRVPLRAVEVGGVTVERALDATWTEYQPGSMALAVSTPGLIGHDVLDGYRAVLDYPAQRFALLPPRRTRPERDAHRWYLRQLRHGSSPDKLVRIAELRLWQGDDEGARRDLERHHARHPAEPEGAVLLARLDRLDGDLDGALAVLADVPAAGLVERGEAAAVVNSRAMRGDVAGALALGEAATAEAPEEPHAWIALSDARRWAGDLTGARDALLQANRLAESPDGNLLRRAWLATLEGDDLGALTHLSRGLELDPSGTLVPWFYSRVAVHTGRPELAIADLDAAAARLHPGQGSLDFMAAAWHQLGHQERAEALAKQGEDRDCTQVEDPSRQANCRAWYRGVVGVDLDRALAEIEEAMQGKPDSSEFLDTYGVVLEARGDLPGAAEAARRAVALNPDDVYLLWQADRLARAAGEARREP